MPSWWQRSVLVVILAVVYAAAARLGLTMASLHGSVSPVWPAAGVAFGALCLGGTWLWPGVALGALGANVFTPEPLGIAALISVGNTLEAVAAVWLWRRVGSCWPDLREFRDVIAVATASLLAPVAAATLGVGALLIGPTAPELTIRLWLTWWAGDALGMLSLAPVVLALSELAGICRKSRTADLARTLLLLGTTAGVSWLAFWQPRGGVFLFAIFPVLLLATAWFEGAGARVLALLFSGAGLVAACKGHGPFVGPDLNQSLINLQVFLAAVAVTALALPAFRPDRAVLLPSLVLLGGWTLSAWMFLLIERADQRREEQFFTDRVAEAQAAINVRLNSYTDALRGGTSFFAASKSVDRDDWRVYTESLNIDKRLPAINGIGVVFVVHPGGENEWLARARADGMPDIKITPFPNTKDEPGADKYLITYLTPGSRNQGTYGRDIATEPTRKAAADAARDTGEPRLHHRAAVSRDMQRRSGLLLYAPIYANGAPIATVAQRRAAIVGWVYAQLFPDVLLRAVLGPAGDVLRLHFFEAGALEPERLLYASAPEPGPDLPRFERLTELDFAGQRFHLGWRRGPRFAVAEKSPAVWAAASFALATLLLAGLIVNLQDISRRANAIAAERTMALTASEERFRQAFEFAGIGMALTALDGRWLRVNRALCQMLGYGEAELLQKTFHDVTHPDDLAIGNTLLRDLVEGTRAAGEITKRYVHRSGRTIWVRLIASLLRDAAGAPLHFVTHIEDITERRQLEENLSRARDQALEASRLKSEFLANMSHEIRTPMNAVSGMAALLAETDLTDEQRGMTRVIQGGADSLVSIINDILDFSRIEAGKLRLDEADFELREVVEETLALLSPRAREKGLAVASEFDVPAGTRVKGDAGRVRQVLTNLVANAIKFTARGGVTLTVRTISTTPSRARFRFDVRDTGIGVPAEARSYLFQPFTQVDGSATRQHGGTGLGLAISRQIVEAMRGEIGFESEVERGSTFWFEVELPYATDEAAPARDRTPVVVDDRTDDRQLPAAAAPAPSAKSHRLLVVEDNYTNQVVARTLLARLGYQVDLAENGEVALELLGARKYDAVLMDCQMPVLDGYETTRRIRAGSVSGLNPRIPVIAVTAYAMAEDRERCLAAGMDEFLTKPIRIAEVKSAIERWVDGNMAVPPAAQTPVPNTSASAVLDPATLELVQRMPGERGGSLLPEIADRFLSEERETPAAIAVLVQRGEAGPLAVRCHAFAGNAASVGGFAARDAALALERAARSGQTDRWPALLTALENEASRLHAALAALIGEGAAR